LWVPESAVLGAGLLGVEGSEPVERREVDHAQRLVDVAAAVLDAVQGVVKQQQDGTCSQRVHGAGCGFVTDNGTAVAVDFAADGSEVFDVWRLRGDGLSLSGPLVVADQDLRSAVRSLQPLLTEVWPVRFSVAN